MPNVRVQFVINLGGIFEIVPMADGAEADVAGDEHSLGRMNRDETGIGVVD